MSSEAAPTRRRLPAAERRVLILEAALDAFAEGGYRDTTLDGVAAKAGVSKALIYEHFTSKQELYEEILETYVVELHQRVVQATADAGEESEVKLVAGLDGFLTFVEERRDAWRLLIRHRASDEMEETFERLYDAAARMVGSLMAPEMPRSVLPDGADFDLVLDAMARQLLGSVTGLANWWDEHRDVPRSQVLEMAMEFGWVGMERAVAGDRWSRPGP